MTTYYVDHAGSNTAPYDTQAKAAPALATILAIPPAYGDIIYCCDNAGAGETIAAELDLQSSGTNAGGWIKLIGVNSSGVEDGTRYVIDGGGNGINIIDMNGQDMWWIENIEVKNTGAGSKKGFYSSTGSCDGMMLVNCCANTCSGVGFDTSLMSYSVLYRCVAYSNTLSGFLCGGVVVKYVFCCARDNSEWGFHSLARFEIMVGCVTHHSTNHGVNPITGFFMMNCVHDGNHDWGVGIDAGTTLYTSFMLGNRITNNASGGLHGNSEPLAYGYNYFEDNNATNLSANTMFKALYSSGTTDSNLADLADTDEGYVDKTNHDFSTDYDADNPVSLRRTAITIPWS
jgi:hypothetical protein